MPVLNWIGKKAVENHHEQVPFHLLKELPELSVAEPGSGNLLIEGDNLLALKALLPYYAGQVKCVYIDPPYNTGQDERDEEGKRRGWIYSDNVNSPEIRDWLNKVVGEEAEDLSRHDKWLCMMYPRLMLLWKFLKEDGVLFASIDEAEFSNLRFLLDDIFGVQNRIGTIVWKNVTDNNPTNIAVEHEYILSYAKNKKRLPKEWKALNLAIKDRLMEVEKTFLSKYMDTGKRQIEYTKWFRENRSQLWPFQDYKFIDEGGIYTGMRSVHNPGKEGYRYDVVHPKTKKPCTQPMMGYRFPKETMDELLAQKRIIFGENETKLIELKVYVKDFRSKLSSLFELDGRVGTNEIKELFPESKRPFDFPKPTELIEELISFTTKANDIVLDSFAGTGTTGHAILKLNQNDNQKRHFVLIEMKSSIARELTAERIRRVAIGYKNARGEKISGIGGGFRYCTLGEPLFNERGEIREKVSFADLARHVYFTETGEPLPKQTKALTALIGRCQGKAVYLLYNGILKDKNPSGGNVLTTAVFSELPKHDGPKVVYGTACRLCTERLRRENIVFKQLPYKLKVDAL